MVFKLHEWGAYGTALKLKLIWYMATRKHGHTGITEALGLKSNLHWMWLSRFGNFLGQLLLGQNTLRAEAKYSRSGVECATRWSADQIATTGRGRSTHVWIYYLITTNYTKVPVWNIVVGRAPYQSSGRSSWGHDERAEAPGNATFVKEGI